MAIIFYRSIRHSFLHMGIIRSGTGAAFNLTRSTFAITVYSGVQPSAATITSTWTSYNTTFLAHWPGVVLNQPNATVGIDSPQALQLYTASGNATAANSGTASWAIMWPTNPSQATISGASLPSTSFIVLPVSLVTGSGMIRFNDLTFTSGSSYAINDVNIRATGGV